MAAPCALKEILPENNEAQNEKILNGTCPGKTEIKCSNATSAFSNKERLKFSLIMSDITSFTTIILVNHKFV